MYQSILVATDGSELSQKAVTSGIDLAVLTKATLVIVKIVPFYSRSYMEGAVPVSMDDEAEIEQRWISEGQAIVNADKAKAEAQGVSAQAVVVRSDLVAEGIIAAATKYQADLIVMASHGRKGIKRLLLGSETQQVLTHSHTPCWFYVKSASSPYFIGESSYLINSKPNLPATQSACVSAYKGEPRQHCGPPTPHPWRGFLLFKGMFMALGWFTLLKTVPWAEVIATAPVVAEGAKKLWKTVAKKPPASAYTPPAPVVLNTDNDILAQLQARIITLEAQTAELHAQMQTSTELIQSLAQQNTELVQRAEAHRKRLQWVSAGLVLLAGALAWAWVYRF